MYEKKICILGLFVVLLVTSTQAADSLRVRELPAPKSSGFKMKGWYIWGGSAIRVESIYHLFASRWPKTTEFPAGYMTHSEIVRATSENPLGPFTFQEKVIGERKAGCWDAGMAHNPTIHKVGDKFVLFYIGTDKGSSYRQIGYATSPSITGPWTRSDKPIDFGQDANNPAVYVEPHGEIKMMWRTKKLRVFVATAPSYDETFTIQNDNVWPHHKLEDFYLFKHAAIYHMICEDNVGGISGHERWGVHFTSPDGVHEWTPAPQRIFYDHTLHFKDGTSLQCERRERPQLLLNENGVPIYLYTSVLYKGQAWNQVVPLEIGK